MNANLHDQVYLSKSLIHKVFHCSSMTNAWYTRYLIANAWYTRYLIALLWQMSDTRGISLLYYDKCLIHEVFYYSSMTNAWYTRYKYGLLLKNAVSQDFVARERKENLRESLVVVLGKSRKGIKMKFCNFAFSKEKKTNVFFYSNIIN